MPDPTAWHVEITHPETGRILVPDVLDDPEINPSLNSLPRIRIPVPKSDQWLDPALEGDPDMAVWREGDRQPIDELREVEERTDRTVLVGVGGVQLERRVEREYQSEERHLAARELITSETDYVEDVDDPVVTRIEDQPQQSAETTAEFEAITDFSANSPATVQNDRVELLQSSFTIEGETSLITTLKEDDAWSGGEATGAGGSFVSVGDKGTYSFTPQYDISAGVFRIRRDIVPDDPNDDFAILPRIEFRINGELMDSLVDGASFDSNLFRSPRWSTIPDDVPTLPAGELVTVEIEVTEASFDFSTVDEEDYSEYMVDLVNVSDGRFDYNFDNEVHEPGGFLDGPEPKPVDTIGFDNTQSPFSIVGGRAVTEFNDTTGEQRIQLSNDGGGTFLPDDGSEQNTETVAVDEFAELGSTIEARATLDRYSPDGARNETPRFGYASQAIQSLETFADIEQQLLLVDERYDDTLENVLNDIATDIEYVWSYRIVDGTPTVSWTQPGQRVADRDPDLGDVTVNKDATTFQKVSVKGSNQRASGEPFEASSTFQQLVRNDILTGSEAVYDTDTGQNFERDSDYEIRYGDGEIRAVDGGDLTIGTSYRIDYEYEIEGTIDLSDDATEPRERVENVPGVTSVRQAEQVAFLFASEFSDARYSADLTVPRSEVTFNAIEALSLSNLNLPDAATPLEVRGEPQITPRGLQLRLGSGGEIADLSAQISRQVRRLSRRS